MPFNDLCGLSRNHLLYFMKQNSIILSVYSVFPPRGRKQYFGAILIDWFTVWPKNETKVDLIKQMLPQFFCTSVPVIKILWISPTRISSFVKYCPFLLDVAFTVHLSNRQTFNAGATVVFDKIISNVGNGYDNTTGFFTVSHNGTYDLTLKTMTLQDAQMYTYLMINEKFSVHRMYMAKICRVSWFHILISFTRR